MIRKRTILFGIIPIVGIVVWFLIKMFQFQINQEQYGDGIVQLQLSRGWLEGRPFLFDNIYGNHALQHNYYLIPLIGIFTKYLGVYGLFVAYLLLLAIFLWQWWSGSSHFVMAQREGLWLGVLFFVFGPIAYYLYLDYFGWHCEQYFIPLLALFSLSLARRQRGRALFWFILICLVKESSSVLICSLLLFVSVADLILENPSWALSQYFFNRRNGVIVVGCFALFCLSMWWLSYLNAGGPSRLSLAFSRVHFTTEFIGFILICVGIGALTFLIGLIPFVPFLRKSPKPQAIVGILLGGYLILWLMFTVESLFYLPVIYPAISFPPRLGGLWAYMLSAFVFLSYRMAQSDTFPERQVLVWALGGCLAQFVLAPLLVAHQFEIDSKPRNISENISYMHKSRLGMDPYIEAIPRQLHELAKKLPEGAEVVVPLKYITYFQNVYPSPWNFDGRPSFVVGKPMVYVCHNDLVKQGFYKDLPQKEYSSIEHNDLLILIDSTTLTNPSHARRR